MLGGGGHALCFVNLGLLKLTNSFGIFLSGRSTRRIAEYFELHLRDDGGISADGANTKIGKTGTVTILNCMTNIKYN